MTGHELIEHAASLGPEAGMAYIAGCFNPGSPNSLPVADFIRAAHSYRDQDAEEYKPDTPEDVRVLLDYAKSSLLG